MKAGLFTPSMFSLNGRLAKTSRYHRSTADLTKWCTWLLTHGTFNPPQTSRHQTTSAQHECIVLITVIFFISICSASGLYTVVVTATVTRCAFWLFGAKALPLTPPLHLTLWTPSARTLTMTFCCTDAEFGPVTVSYPVTLSPSHWDVGGAACLCTLCRTVCTQTSSEGQPANCWSVVWCRNNLKRLTCRVDTESTVWDFHSTVCRFVVQTFSQIFPQLSVNQNTSGNNTQRKLWAFQRIYCVHTNITHMIYGFKIVSLLRCFSVFSQNELNLFRLMVQKKTSKRIWI